MKFDHDVEIIKKEIDDRTKVLKDEIDSIRNSQLLKLTKIKMEFYESVKLSLEL